MLTIRLARIGKKKKPYYRVVVIERTRARDGRVREAVGTYDPLKKPAEIKLNSDRIKYWLGVGAQPSGGQIRTSPWQIYDMQPGQVPIDSNHRVPCLLR